jgi:hypothetical protein
MESIGTEARITAPGLKWRRRADGAAVPYWVARASAVAAGYPIKTANLSSLAPDQVADRCAALEAEMVAWLAGVSRRGPTYDGTLGSLLRLYQVHDESPYRSLKRVSLHAYNHYLRRLIDAYGDVRLDRVTGIEIKRWHRTWLGDDGSHVAGAAMAVATMKAALRFGRILGLPHCGELKSILADLRLPKPKPRTFAPTAGDVDKLRAAAHALGHHRAALCYALQFEACVRQWDLIGQWEPLSDPRPSAVLHHGRKWIGPTWSAIDGNLILRLTPSKTERTTGAKVIVALSGCRMVIEELATIPVEARSGPLIVNEVTGRPYARQAWEWLWQAVREAAGLPSELWNRDLRAGGVTEAQMAGAAAEDRSKLAGHSVKINEGVYARDRLVASNRVIEARQRFRDRT